MAFDSGGIFNSKSDSKTDSTNNNSGFSDINDGSVVTSLQGIEVSGKNASSTINMLDGGAIAKSFDFAGGVAAQGYDFARDVQKSTASTVEGAVRAVSESARSETENIFINLQKYALYGVMIWGAVQIFKGAK